MAGSSPRTQASRRCTAAAELALAAGLALTVGAAFGIAEDLSGTAGALALILRIALGAAAQVTAFPRGHPPEAAAGTRLARSVGARTRMLATLVVAVGTPIAGLLAMTLLLRPSGWVLADVVMGVGALGAFADARSRRRGRRHPPPEHVVDALTRLCLRADMPVPPLVVHRRRFPTAWTHEGRVHLTGGLLDRLSRPELEAVIAHELAHLAYRDAAVMDVARRLGRSLLDASVDGLLLRGRLARDGLRGAVGAWLLGFLLVLPAALLAAISHLLVLDLSRARELRADAAAAALTGRPAALASALLELDPHGRGFPRADLRSPASEQALRIVELRRSRIALLRTHPSIARRVAALEAMEARLRS